MKEIAQDSQVNISLNVFKILKIIIFNLSTKINAFMEGFLLRVFFCTRFFFYAHGVFFYTTVLTKSIMEWEIKIPWILFDFQTVWMQLNREGK